MATLYATGTQLNVGLHQRVNANTEDASVRFIRKTYTMTGAEAQNDVIRIAHGKQGDIIIPELSFLTSDGIASTATDDVGDTDLLGVGAAADADRYCDGANVAAANTRPLFSATGNPPASVTLYVLGSDCWIEATFATLVTPVAGKKLQFVIAVLGA